MNARLLRVGIRAVVLISALATLTCRDKPQTLRSVTVVSWGGRYQDLLFSEWVIPAAEKARIPVDGQSYNGEYQTITRMAQSNTTSWDLVQVETFFAAQAKSAGLLEQFDPKPTGFLASDATASLAGYAYPTIGWSYVLAWNQAALDQRRLPAPSGWNAIWDFSRFPGKRALRDVPQGNIEMALLADGLSRADITNRLYKAADLSLVERAFKKLDGLHGQVVWWSSGDQVQRELENAGVTLAATWNGRVWLGRTRPLSGKQVGPDIRLDYRDAILDWDWWIVPKGSRNASLAARLVNELYHSPDGAIRFAQSMGYGPPIESWETRLKGQRELLELMPTTVENVSGQLVSDPSFWSKHYTHISERWTDWRARQ